MEDPPDWQDRRRIILNRDGHRCQRCGAKSLPSNEVALDVHHVRPRSRGGTHALENLEPLCQQCHAKRHPGNSELAERANLPPFLLRLVLLPLSIVQTVLQPGETRQRPVEVTSL